MKFLADENISPVVVEQLRKRGYDVFDIKEEGKRGLADNEIAKLAVKEERIIITQDKTFPYAINPSLKTKILLISFQHKQATREKMQIIGWYIANYLTPHLKENSKLHLRLDTTDLKIYHF